MRLFPAKIFGNYMPIYSTRAGDTDHWFAMPFRIVQVGLNLLWINAVVWGVIGLYEAVRVIAHILPH